MRRKDLNPILDAALKGNSHWRALRVLLAECLIGEHLPPTLVIMSHLPLTTLRESIPLQVADCSISHDGERRLIDFV